MVAVWRDDLGHPVELPGPARRVMSLVPSLTEAVAVSATGRLAGGRRLVHPSGRPGGDPGGPSLATARADLLRAIGRP